MCYKRGYLKKTYLKRTCGMKSYQEMIRLFECANAAFLKNDKALLANQVSERTLCGALMLHIHDIYVLCAYSSLLYIYSLYTVYINFYKKSNKKRSLTTPLVTITAIFLEISVAPRNLTLIVLLHQ